MQPYASNVNYQQQIDNATNAYNQAKAVTQAQQNAYSSYNNNMQRPDQLYGQDLSSAQKMYGFNPQDLAKANQNLAYSQDQLVHAPEAAQQQGNYYGTTAGAEVNNYNQIAGNLNSTVADQTNAVNAFQNLLAATQNQANQQATLGYQGEQLKSQNYQNLVANALGLQTQAGDQQKNFIAQQGNAGTYLVGQAQARAAAAQAAAAQTAANASYMTAQQQVEQANQIKDAFQKLYGDQWQLALGEMLGNQKITVPQASAPSNGGGLTVGTFSGGIGQGFGPSSNGGIRLQ